MIVPIFACLLGVGLTQSTCPSYQCESLKENVCMSWSKGRISLNSNGCPLKYVCSLSLALTSYALSPESGTYMCQSASEGTLTTGYNYCGDDIPYKKSLLKGSFPKECFKAGYSDYNCLVDDGSYLECRCGMQGKLFCNPGPSSDQFQNFWDECEKNDYVVKAKFFQYYQTYYEFFVEYESALECSIGLFSEFGIIRSDVPGSGSGGMWIGVVLVSFLAVI